MRKFAVSIAVMLALFAMIMTSTASAVEPDWAVFNGIVDNPNNLVATIIEDLSGYHTPTDAGPWSMGYIGGSYDTYCNTDRDVEFVNWVSVAQWMRIQVENMYLHVMIRKPGTYTVETPMRVRIASNADVLTTFQEIWGSGGWDPKWYEYPNKTYPQLANELTNQIPIDKKYKVVVYGETATTESSAFLDIPAGDGVIKFKNTEDLHNLENPTVGFDLYFQEIVRPCNTTGDYVLVGRLVFQAYNQMWYIDPTDGTIDRSRDSGAVPPAAYQG